MQWGAVHAEKLAAYQGLKVISIQLGEFGGLWETLQRRQSWARALQTEPERPVGADMLEISRHNRRCMQSCQVLCMRFVL